MPETDAGGDLAYHELYSTGNPAKDYFDLFTFAGRASRMPHNKETILAYVYNYDLAATARTYHNLSRELMVPDQIIRFNPTQAHIDSYLCDDGLPIEKSPKYKGNGTYTPAYSAYDSIFVSRDPRMKHLSYIRDTINGKEKKTGVEQQPSILKYLCLLNSITIKKERLL